MGGQYSKDRMGTQALQIIELTKTDKHAEMPK